MNENDMEQMHRDFDSWQDQLVEEHYFKIDTEVGYEMVEEFHQHQHSLRMQALPILAVQF